MTTPITNAILTPPAPHESNISREHEYTDVIMLSGVVCDTPLDKLLAPYLPGAGRVDLVKISVKFNATAEKQAFYFGFSSVLSVLTAKQASGKPSGVRFMSNNFTVGNEFVHTLIPEDTLSRQIRPNSADLPMINFLVSADKDALVTIHFYVKVHGIRQHHGDLK
jgi:hypothetical protein